MKNLLTFLFFTFFLQASSAQTRFPAFTPCSGSNFLFTANFIEVNGGNPGAGSYICAFDENGNQASSEYQITGTNGQFQMIVYSDCDGGGDDGMNDGETMTFRVYDSTSESYYAAEAIGGGTTWPNHEGFYFENAGLGVTHNASVLLPVEWLYFQVEINNETVHLNWATAQEINSEKYIVEHSRDGKNFNAIGTLDAAGYSYNEVKYQLHHDKPEEGVNYYRVKQIDYDSSYDYSPVRSVEIKAGNKVKLFPNPVGHTLNIAFGKNFPEGATWFLYDFSGNKIMQGKWNNNSPKSLVMNELTAGNYFLKITDGYVNIIERFLKK